MFASTPLALPPSFPLAPLSGSNSRAHTAHAHAHVRISHRRLRVGCGHPARLSHNTHGIPAETTPRCSFPPPCPSQAPLLTSLHQTPRIRLLPRPEPQMPCTGPVAAPTYATCSITHAGHRAHAPSPHALRRPNPRLHSASSWAAPSSSAASSSLRLPLPRPSRLPARRSAPRTNPGRTWCHR